MMGLASAEGQSPSRTASPITFFYLINPAMIPVNEDRGDSDGGEPCDDHAGKNLPLDCFDLLLVLSDALGGLLVQNHGAGETKESGHAYRDGHREAKAQEHSSDRGEDDTACDSEDKGQ